MTMNRRIHAAAALRNPLSARLLCSVALFVAFDDSVTLKLRFETLTASQLPRQNRATKEAPATANQPGRCDGSRNTRVAVNASYPILLVPADGIKVPPATDGVALATNGDLPPNLVAPDVLAPLLSRMWKQSRTFRRQCARIGAEPGLQVRVLTGATVHQSGGRAVTHIQRGATGLQAAVFLASHADPGDLIELIAHEFEHIIEQLDGLDLPRLARLAPLTVWPTGERGFETERATQTGRLVAAEVEGRAG